MTLVEKVQELQAAGMVAARQILAAITAPTKVQGTASVPRPGAAQERALRELIVPALLAQSAWNNLANAGTLEDRVNFLLAQRLKAATDDTVRTQVLTLAYLINDQERLVRRKGGEPYAPAAGTDARTEPSFTEGPSWWDQNFPGQPAPTIKNIREAMT